MLDKSLKDKFFLIFILTESQFSSMSCNYVNLNTLSANPTKWSDTLKQFVGCCQRNTQIIFYNVTRAFAYGIAQIRRSRSSCNVVAMLNLNIHISLLHEVPLA